MMTRTIERKTRWNMENPDERQAAALRLFGALSGVDEAYLEACEADGRSGAVAGAMSGGHGKVSEVIRFLPRYNKVIAAVLCMALLGAGYLGVQYVRSGGVASGSNLELADEKPDMAAQFAADSAAAGVVEAPAAAEEAPEAVRDEMPAEAILYAEDVDESAAAVKGENGADAGTAVTAESAESEMNDYNTENTPADLRADARTDEAKETTMEKGDADQRFSSTEPQTEMTIVDARDLAVVGEYLPSFWPGNGQIESVRGSDAKGSESIALTWKYGNQWDGFLVTVTNLGTKLPEWVQEATADVSKPEMYDRSLYEIPYADTVPQEYAAVFQDPVFAREDFTRECVSACIRTNPGDGGDTDTPRGSFRVLYQTEKGEYVLASFNGQGSVDEIWSMMRSIRYYEGYVE